MAEARVRMDNYIVMANKLRTSAPDALRGVRGDMKSVAAFSAQIAKATTPNTSGRSTGKLRASIGTRQPQGITSSGRPGFLAGFELFASTEYAYDIHEGRGALPNLPKKVGRGYYNPGYSVFWRFSGRTGVRSKGPLARPARTGNPWLARATEEALATAFPGKAIKVKR